MFETEGDVLVFLVWRRGEGEETKLLPVVLPGEPKYMAGPYVLPCPLLTSDRYFYLPWKAKGECSRLFFEFLVVSGTSQNK
jgi:hypothetical protein